MVPCGAMAATVPFTSSVLASMIRLISGIARPAWSTSKEILIYRAWHLHFDDNLGGVLMALQISADAPMTRHGRVCGRKSPDASTLISIFHSMRKSQTNVQMSNAVNFNDGSADSKSPADTAQEIDFATLRE
jgi:hypothetical protein